VRVLVCGSRNWTNTGAIYSKLAEYGCGYAPFTLIHGNARGADSIAADYAKDRAKEILAFPANWNLYGKAAGAIRNRQMLEEGRPELVLAFWDGVSKGTWHMINLARKAGVKVEIIKP
jgi:hypothetical protein